jgi:hypothetical protein
MLPVWPLDVFEVPMRPHLLCCRDCCCGGAAAGTAPSAFSADNWVQGSNYFLIRPELPTSVAPGKVEVTEVFSYACPACNRFYPVVDRLRAALPANAELNFCRRGVQGR